MDYTHGRISRGGRYIYWAMHGKSLPCSIINKSSLVRIIIPSLNSELLNLPLHRNVQSFTASDLYNLHSFRTLKKNHSLLQDNIESHPFTWLSIWWSLNCTPLLHRKVSPTSCRHLKPTRPFNIWSVIRGSGSTLFNHFITTSLYHY